MEWSEQQGERRSGGAPLLTLKVLRVLFVGVLGDGELLVELGPGVLDVFFSRLDPVAEERLVTVDLRPRRVHDRLPHPVIAPHHA